MENKFLENVLKKNSSFKDVIYDKELQNFRDQETFRGYLGAFLLITLYQTIPLGFTLGSGIPNLELYCIFAEIIIAVSVLMFILTLIFRKKKNLITIFKYIQFFIFYANHLYLIYGHSILIYNTVRTVKNIYIIYLISTLLLVFFLNFNLYLIVGVSAANLVCAVIAEVGVKKFVFQAAGTFLPEVFFGIIIPLACLYTKYQYNHLIRLIENNLKISSRSVKYIGDLIEHQILSIIMISKGKIVYSNETFKKLTEKNDQNGKNNEGEKNSSNNEFLEHCIFNYITPEYDYITKLHINNKKTENQLISSKEHFEKINNINNINTNDDEDTINAFDFLCLLEKTIKEQDNENNSFNLLGIIQHQNKYFYNLSFRKMNLNGISWIEVILNDVTLMKNFQTIDETFKLKEKILGKIAHEFKTPLICMMGLSEHLEHETTDPKILEKVYQINDLSNYTLFLINDIIHFLRNNKVTTDFDNFETSLNNNGNRNEKLMNLVLNNQKVDINEVVDFSFRILKTLLSQKNKNVQALKDIRIPLGFQIETDSVRLKQIILNFINNAVKFTQSGTIRIKAKIKDDNLMIEVIDSGVGIKEEDHEKLFKEFNMLESTIVMNEMGSGLGLAICQSLSVLLKAKLGFKSKYGKGSTFWVSFPVNNEISNNLVSLYNKNKRNNKAYCFTSNINNKLKQDEIRLELKKNKTETPQPQTKIICQPNINIQFNDYYIQLNNDINSFTNINNNNNNNNFIHKRNSNEIKENLINNNNNNNKSSLNIVEESHPFSNSLKEKSPHYPQIIETNSLDNTLQLHEIDVNNLNILRKYSNRSSKCQSHSNIINMKPSTFQRSLNSSEININHNINKNYKSMNTQNSNSNNKSKEKEKAIIKDNNENNNEHYQEDQEESLINNKFEWNEVGVGGGDFELYSDDKNVGIFDSKQTNIINKNQNIILSKNNSININNNNNSYNSNGSILVIDDNIQILNSFKRLMNNILIKYSINMDIITGLDGVDLLKYIIDDQRKSSEIRIVFIDENMEYMNGSEAIRIIRQFENSSKVKKVFICKISADSTDLKSKLGADFDINKPFTEKDLENVLIEARLLC